MAALADDVLCDASFLEDVVALLEDKRQVILYGPPGTGKTYFARQLAWTLTGIRDDGEYEDDGPFSLVQFHPAYSYEDFFEGYRPAVDDDGHMTYRLTPGPLVRLAAHAAEHPDELHVMVIDEINRANLPRVLGELLFLLEYRDEWTQTQYRPIDGFTLPSNLWIIGTMNTADRSIALIDAAMRRRFHFVPFFPNKPPTAGLLLRWTQRNAPGQAWVAELLDRVNGELEQALGGDHLLIGPSHFIKWGLDETSVRRIWEYNIEPLIEDQLFGQQEVISRFRFDAVLTRHGPDANAPDSEGKASAGPVDDPEAQPAHNVGSANRGGG
ncbi:McrB family protein [Candidatus Poriferisodalis sp.]|uniref:McrB family protein n=1 Tax=Candidatus Poriferisodalis sp. TaxID=3101277 RepID=UPI003B52CACD